MIRFPETLEIVIRVWDPSDSGCEARQSTLEDGDLKDGVKLFLGLVLLISEILDCFNGILQAHVP